MPKFKKDDSKKNQRVLTHLRHRGSLDRQAAFALFGLFNLPKQIFELRKKGIEIKTQGKGKNLRYFLPRDSNESSGMTKGKA